LLKNNLKWIILFICSLIPGKCCLCKVKMARRKDWSPKKRATAVTLRKEGYSYRQIAVKIGDGVTASGIRKLFKRFEVSGSVTTQPGKGRKRSTTPKTDRRISRMALKNWRATSQDINKVLRDTGISVSARTVRRRLVAVGLRARIPRKKPFLNVTQRQKRLQWAKEHVSWTVEQWKKVVWSDECRISIFGSDGVFYVRRRSGEECLPECLTPTMKHPVSVMVWACMAWSGVGWMQLINGTLNASRYINEVLETKLMPSVHDIFGDISEFVFQQDGAPCHTAKTCIKWFTDHNVQLLTWPGNSPDLNPIENLWSRLKKLVAAKHPSNKRELIEAIINSWYHVITPDNLKSLVESMPRRCKAVIASRGYPTRY